MTSLPPPTRRARRIDPSDDLMGMEPLIDTTLPLAKMSKKTKRLTKKLAGKPSKSQFHLLDLPLELVLHILSCLPPSTLLPLHLVSKLLHHILTANSATLSAQIIAARYASLAQCFRRPVLARDLDPAIVPLFANRRYAHYLHISSPPTNPSLICGCATCWLRWVGLCTIVDFAHWRGHLESGEPIPVVPRAQVGDPPAWSRELLVRHREKVVRALERPLWYARLLEMHLDSTVAAVRRHRANPSNRRRRFEMSEGDVRCGSDEWLERKGPPTVDVPYQRDGYYMLEAFMPNRGWSSEEGRWVYVPEGAHDWDLRRLVTNERRRRLDDLSGVGTTVTVVADMGSVEGQQTMVKTVEIGVGNLGL